MLGAALAAAALAGPGGSGMNVACMMEHCAEQSAECMLNKVCREELICSAECMEHWGDDPTPQKVHGQNCTTKCGLTYIDKATDDYMECVMSHDCISFPPINVTCPAERLTAHLDPNASLTTMQGEWWQQWGYNALYDCYPCQHVHSMYKTNDSMWSYTYSQELFLVNGSLQYWQQTWQLPDNQPGTPAPITYSYMGTLHNETWYILDAKPERYVVLVDCSYMFTWTNVGSIVWVRPNVVLTQQELDSISAVYKRAMGWDFPSQFCPVQHGETCPPPTNAITGPRRLI